MALTGLGSQALARERTDYLYKKLYNPREGIFVVAHRGCHNAYPARGIGPAPENSILALENCIRLGADMMETDVRRSKDGALVIMHDETVDRTTNGSGRVADLTLSDLRVLRLRQNFGGAMSPDLTAQRVLTLDEILAAARGKIMLNLDIKEAIYPEVVAAVRRLGAQDQVLVKTIVDTPQAPLTDEAPYNEVPFIPILQQKEAASRVNFAEVLSHQVVGRRRIAAVEMAFLTKAQFSGVCRVAEKAEIRLWVNTLTSVGVISVIGFGGDTDALRNPSAWGCFLDHGVTAIQTDEPGPLMDYLRSHRLPLRRSCPDEPPPK